MLLDQRLSSAEAGADHHGQPLRRHFGCAGVGPRLSGGDHGHLLAAVHAPRLDPAQYLGRFLTQPACQPYGQVAGPWLVQHGDRGFTGEQRRPGGVDVGAQGRGHSQAGDHNAGRTEDCSVRETGENGEIRELRISREVVVRCFVGHHGSLSEAFWGNVLPWTWAVCRPLPLVMTVASTRRFP